MEAPRKAYITDSDGQLSELSGCLIGRFLAGSTKSGYSDSASTMQFNVRRLFLLDELLMVRRNGRLGFVGAVIKDGYNASKRDMSRRDSGLRMRLGDDEYVLLNDAGLNVMPHLVSINTIGEGTAVNPDNWVVFENFRRMKFSITNAFYGTAQYRLYAKKITADSWHEVSSGQVAPGASVSLEWDGVIPIPPIVSGTQLYLSARLEVTNDEGTVTDEKGPVMLRPSVTKITVYKTERRSDPWNAGTPIEVYIGENDYDRVHVIVSSSQNQPLDKASLPDGGKLWRLVGDSGFVELTDGMYNIWAYSGVVYGGGRMSHIYRPNSETEEPYWKVVVGASISKYGSDDGWPEAVSSGYMYRIAVTARFVAVAGITTDPPSVQVSGISVGSVMESGMPVSAMLFDRSKWDGDTVLRLSSSVRSTQSKTYIYAKDIPTVEKAYGIRVAYDITPESMVSESETEPLP